MGQRAAGGAGWGPVVGLTAFIYATLPVMPVVWRAVDRRAPNVLGPSAWLLALCAVGAMWRTIWVHRAERRPLPLGVLAITTGLFAWGITSPTFPAERFHFLEYGLLGMLTLRASFRTVPDRWAATFGLASLVLCIIGAGDEVVQAMLPNRVFDWHDIWFNIYAGLLGFGAYLGMAPPTRRS
ncbi:MAG: VanZ family protein [Candidatus Tectimicrobiota bacterium]